MAVGPFSRLADDAAENFEGTSGHSREHDQPHSKGTKGGAKVGAGVVRGDPGRSVWL